MSWNTIKNKIYDNKKIKTPLWCKITSKFEINKHLTSRGTREKQWDCESSIYDFSSRNKIKVT